MATDSRWALTRDERVGVIEYLLVSAVVVILSQLAGSSIPILLLGTGAVAVAAVGVDLLERRVRPLAKRVDRRGLRSRRETVAAIVVFAALMILFQMNVPMSDSVLQTVPGFAGFMISLATSVILSGLVAHAARENTSRTSSSQPLPDLLR